VVEVDPEPEYELVAVEEGAAPVMPRLLMNATCDYCALLCETPSVNFKSTMMFQTRTHTFPIQNTSEVELRFTFDIRASNGAPEPLKPADAPFTVSPVEGRIAPRATQEVTVAFSPTEVDSYLRQLICTCDNLAPGQGVAPIVLGARSTRPFCHFELNDSDYLRTSRRSPEMPGPDGSLSPLDPATKVIEFESLGTKVRNTKRFYVVNPTNVPYEFVWDSEQELRAGREALGSRPFRCHSRKGMVLPGRKFEMVFDFTPDSVNLQESFWRFRIPSLRIDVPFLLVGATVEPNVSIDRTRHNFGPLLIGQKARETIHIVNREHIPFAFNFERASFATGGLGAESVIEVTPSSGVVGPDSSMPIELLFAPTLEKQFNFNVELSIKNKSRSLVLNVKGEGYAIHDVLLLEDANGKPMELSAHAPTRVDFGLVHVNDKAIKQLTVVNSGRFNFDVAMQLRVPSGVRAPPVSVTPELATIKRNERFVFQLTYQPSSDASLPTGLGVLCSITNGPTYSLQLLGRGKRPRLSFSFLEHDFGPCFVVTPHNGMAPVTTTLRLSNDDENEVYFDMPFEGNAFLSATASRTVLAPGDEAEVTLVFSPPTADKFEVQLPFLVNGLSSVMVPLRGEGCELRLELADSSDQHVHFGSVHPQQQSSRSVSLINRSRKAVDISLVEAADALRSKAVSMALSGGALDGTLRPRESTMLELRFQPSLRIRPFSEQLVLRVCGLPRPILILDGACIAMDLKLEMDQLTFGQVVLNSRITRRLMLQNLGDMPSAFRLDKSRFEPDFSVSPLEGYLQPNEDVNLEVTFHPAAVNRDIRYERVPVQVDGQAPLALTLTGMCVDASPESRVLTFKTRVREPSKQSIEVKNTSPTLWRIQPIVQDESWTGAEVLEVQPGQTATYEVEYCPMVMTAEGEKHTGSVFFPLADGSAIYYQLEGTAGPPQEAGVIDQSFPCKHAATIPLTVQNWLKVPQRFKVDIRAPNADPSTQLTGHQYVDVPASLSREFSLSFYSYKEGTTAAEVHFLNEKTSEYLFYQLSLKAQPADVLQTIDMQAPLRQLTTHDLQLANPLGVPASFTATVDNAEVSIPASITVPAQGQDVLRIEWRPLLPRETTSRLTLTSPELGTYSYDLKLVALQAGETKSLAFQVALGDSQTLRFRFLNFLRRPETYKVTLGGSDFEAESTVAAPAAQGSAGAEVSVDVTFEPSKLGDVLDTLTVSHADGGEYVCALQGTSLPPKPQGPIAIKAGGSAQVNFKNVFANQMDFSITCEPAVFSVAKPRESVPSKKPTQIAVSYKPADPAAPPATGKLTIASIGMEPTSRWVYYLQGQP